MKQWFIAHTQPCKETIAQQHLLEQGFDVYLPRFKKIRRHARKVEEVASPLFPRYLFVGMDLDIARWRSVNGTRGIAYLLMNDNRPIPVSTDIIDDLRSQENGNGVVPISCVATFVKGEKLRIVEGAFKDQTVTFETWDDKQRVQLLLTFLGREMKVSLPVYAVEAA